MNRSALIAILGLAACAPHLSAQSTAPVSADPWFRAGTWMITLEIGGAAFSDFDRTKAAPADGGVGQADFSRRVSARTAASVGGWGSYWLSDRWGLRTGLSYVPSSFTVWSDEAEAQPVAPGDGTAFDEHSYASLDIWMAHAVLLFRFPHSFGRVAPYGLAGGGVVRYRARGDAELPPEARAHFADGGRQRVAGVFGVGAVIPLQRRNLLMSFELTNHVSRTPLDGQNTAELFDLGGRLMALSTDAGTGNGGEVGLTSHVRLALGLTLPLR